MCIDGYVRHTYINHVGVEEHACIYKVCKPGEMMRTNVNGITFCEPCTIPNCH